MKLLIIMAVVAISLNARSQQAKLPGFETLFLDYVDKIEDYSLARQTSGDTVSTLVALKAAKIALAPYNVQAEYEARIPWHSICRIICAVGFNNCTDITPGPGAWMICELQYRDCAKYWGCPIVSKP